MKSNRYGDFVVVFVSFTFFSSLVSFLQCTALEAKLCQIESKYLVLLQEVKNPVCSSSEQSPAREVISRLLEDALQVDSTDQQEGHPIFKPHTVRYGPAVLQKCFLQYHYSYQPILIISCFLF